MHGAVVIQPVVVLGLAIAGCPTVLYTVGMVTRRWALIGLGVGLAIVVAGFLPLLGVGL
jgi:hypothetical protein